MREGRAVWYGLSTLTPAAGSHQSTARTATSADAADQRQVQPAHAGDEEDGGEHRDVDERGAGVGLDEDEQHGHGGERDRLQRHREPTSTCLRVVGEEARRATSASSTFPNSDGWKVKKPMSIQRFEPRVAAPKTSTNAITPQSPT